MIRIGSHGLLSCGSSKFRSRGRGNKLCIISFEQSCWFPIQLLQCLQFSSRAIQMNRAPGADSFLSKPPFDFTIEFNCSTLSLFTHSWSNKEIVSLTRRLVSNERYIWSTMTIQFTFFSHYLKQRADCAQHCHAGMFLLQKHVYGCWKKDFGGWHMYLMTKADTKQFTTPLMKLLKQGAQFLDPLFMAVCIVATSCDHKAFILVKLFLAGKLALHNKDLVPNFAWIPQHLHKHGTVAPVGLRCVVCCMPRRQNCKPARWFQEVCGLLFPWRSYLPGIRHRRAPLVLIRCHLPITYNLHSLQRPFHTISAEITIIPRKCFPMAQSLKTRRRGKRQSQSSRETPTVHE